MMDAYEANLDTAPDHCPECDKIVFDEYAPMPGKPNKDFDACDCEVKK